MSNNSDKDTLADIIALFDVEGSVEEVDVITNGNINSTYLVKLLCGDVNKKYVLQRINTYVFKAPEQIMSNIAYVTGHIEKRNTEGGLKTLHFYPERSTGRIYHDDGEGNFWRLCDHIESLTLSKSSDPAVLESLGAAFGDFQNSLADFDASLLYETIPDFHNTKKRLDTLFLDAEKDEYGRCAECAAEYEFIVRTAGIATDLISLMEQGSLPLRVTHNDTKLNNVLFDTDGSKPIAIIDLDTVMPGLAAYDYGDAIRFAGSNAAEDEKELDKVWLDMDKFRAFSKGFVEKTKDSLTELELLTLPKGAVAITIELASRFLDDYITGDKYFKTLYEGHNLVRTRCQLKLAADMLKKLPEMEAYIKELIK